MNKFIRTLQTYLLYASPFVLICMTWATVRSESEILKDASFLVKASWELLSWNLMLWFTSLIIFLILLVVHPETREKTLKRLANLKERDEREQYITGRASRSAYVATLSLLILLLFLSIFSLNIHRVPENEAINGKRGTVTIGLNFSLMDRERIENDSSRVVLFESRDIPLSKTAIILILIIWQLGVFGYAARKENLITLKE